MAPRRLQLRHHPSSVDTLPLRERTLIIRKTRNSGPSLLIRRSKQPKDLEDLVDLRVTGKERFAGAHFRKDAADGPHIYACGVLLAAEENLG